MGVANLPKCYQRFLISSHRISLFYPLIVLKNAVSSRLRRFVLPEFPVIIYTFVEFVFMNYAQSGDLREKAAFVFNIICTFEL